MKKTFLVVAILILGFSSIYASPINIKGVVKDSTSKEFLPYCEVLLKNQKDSLITGCITNEKGEFSLNTSVKDSIYIQTRLFGYSSKKINISIIDTTVIYTIADILMNTVSKELEGIEISALRPFVEKKFDRDVFNMSEGAVASARNIFDLLKKIPGIVVDEENSIVKFKGNTATVRINNTPAERMYPKLEMIPIADVDKIEVIDPTMRGKGNGSAGAIVNIKMKKVVLEGLSGSFGSNITVGDSALIQNGHVYSNVNYKVKKFLIYNNLGTWGNNWVSNSKSWGTRSDENGSFIDSSTSKFNGKWAGLWEYAGMQYTINEKSKIDFQIGTNTNYINKNSSFSSSNIINANTNTIVDSYTDNSNTEGTKGNKSLSLGLTYTAEIDTLGKELTIDFWGSTYNSSSLSKSAIDYLYSPDIIESQNRKYASDYMWFSVFYNNPISDKTQWNIEYSCNNSFDNSSSNFIRNDIYEYGFFKNNKTKDYENSLSAHFGTTLKKIKIDAGVSLQNKISKGDRTIYYSSISDTLVSTNKMFNKLLPVATIKYNISDKKELKLSYDCNSQMPYSVDMFETFLDSSNQRNWSTGNPDLKPALNQSVYFGYTFTDEKWNTSLQAFVKSTNNNYTNVDIPIDSVTTLSKPMNLEKNQSLGLFYSFYKTFGKAFTFSFNTNWFYSKVDITKVKPYLIASGVPAENLIRNSWNCDLSSDIEYRKGKNFASANIYYNSKQISTMGYEMPKFNMDLSYSRTFFKNNLRLSLSFNNLLYGLYKEGSVNNVMGRDMHSESFNNRNRRSVGFSIRYNFRDGDRNTSSKGKGGK
ncbi:MAG: outer membrane beta-barrel protein [Bacteroidota bacterium]